MAYRLGYLRGGASEVLSHVWFEDFDWDGLVNMSVAPPWRPQLKRADDASFFDDSEGGDASIGASPAQVGVEYSHSNHIAII